MATPKLREPNRGEQVRIRIAIEDDDAVKLQKLLQTGIDVNAPLDYQYYYANGWTPLHWAACFDGINCSKIILKCNANLSITDKDGETPLQVAISYDSYQVVYQLMVEYNQKTSDLTPGQKKKALSLINRYRKEHPEIIKIGMLLEDGPYKKAYFRRQLSKGELIDMTYQWIVASSDPPVLVDCQKNQLRIVDHQFIPYLFAVNDLSIRHDLFINNLISLASNMLLNVGDRVDVFLEQHAIPSPAIVKYKGNLSKKIGIFFGVEILDENKFGDTDGTYNNKKYFTCPRNKGLFVSTDKIQAKISDSVLLEYAKQAAYGLAQSRSFKITFVGPEGSGKTSTIRTLLGKKFNPNEVSTIGAVLGIRAIINRVMGNKTTEEVETFELKTSLGIGWKEASGNDVHQILDKEFNKEMCSKLSSLGRSMLESDCSTSKSQPNDPISNFKESCEPFAQSDYSFEEGSNVQEMEDVTGDDSEQYSEVKSVVFGEKVDELDSHACISDFAGQLTFFSFQLFFLKKRDTVIITFNASLKLTTKIIPRERYDHARKKRIAAGMMTIIENIEFWLQSVSAHAGTDDIPEGCISRRSPTAILCGTHAEKLSMAKMNEISKQILEHLAAKPYVNHLPKDRTKAIIFISNKNRKKFASNIVRLQSVLMEAAKPAYTEERPISYLRLEQLIACKVEEGVNMMSIIDFTTLINEAGIRGERNSEAIAAALQYCSTRGTILYFPEVALLSQAVFISPQWLSSIFSKIITTHDQVVEDHSLYQAWKRFDKFAILEEQFLDHILTLSGVLEHKEVIISLMKSFNLLAEVPNDIHLIGKATLPGRVFIVPALLFFDPNLAVYTADKDNQSQSFVFSFPDMYFPESAFNQILVKMITWNIGKAFTIYRIQHGLGQFHLGDSQHYHLIYEANKYCLKIIVTQLNTTLSLQEQATSFKLFLELMMYLEESIHSVINLYIPSTKLPVLYVVCPLCDVTTPHILLESARKISLKLPSLCCGEKDIPEKIPRSSYLPFSDTLTYEAFKQLQKSTKQLSESAVLLQFYKDLQNGISLDELLPQLIAKRIITIDDKILIAQSGRSVNERCQYFLDQHISKPLSAGDSSAFYKFLLVIDASSKYSMLATKIKQSLMVESLQDKTFELNLSDNAQKQLPELDALVTFYEKICVSLPTDELLPKLVTERVITINDKSKIVNTGKTEFERTQHLLDHHIAKPLSVGDPRFFNILLDLMSTTPKCDFLVNEMQQFLSTRRKHQKFPGSRFSAPIENSAEFMNTL